MATERRPAPQQPRIPPPEEDPAKRIVWQDPWVYRLAVGGVGVALVAFLIGGAVVGASGHVKDMVQEYWTIGAALSGALVGIIVPSPRQKQESAAGQGKPARAQAAAPMLQPLLTIIVFAVTLWLATEVDPVDAALLRTVAAASAGALAGLLVPSPGSHIKA